jgi:hypothetical protein
LDWATPNVLIQENFAEYDVPWRNDLVCGWSSIQNGEFLLHEKPGLGIEIDAEVCDLRGLRERHPELYDPESYAASQPFGEALRRAEANGIVYGSVRRPTGTNLVVYRPSLLPPVLQGDHFDYRWTGSPAPAVVKLTGVGDPLP